MMNLESLRQKIQSQFIEVEAGGETWRVGKLLAADYLGLSSADHDDASRVAHYLSKTLTDESGGRPFDSDEGRRLLSQLDAETYLTLSNAAVEFNTSKKK